MTRLIWWLGFIALASACSSPTAPTQVKPPVPITPAVVIVPVLPVPVVCSTATPTFRVTSGERVGDRWKNFFTWQPLEASSQVYLVEWRNWNEVTPHTFTQLGTFIERYDFGDGVFEARVRLACSQAWSEYVTFSNGCWLGCGPQVPTPPVPPPTPRCHGTGCV